MLPGQIGSLQATHMSHEATIRNLDQEQNRLKEKISRLEEDREALLNQSQNTNEQHKQQVFKLEQVLPLLLVMHLPCAESEYVIIKQTPFPPQSLREEHQGYEKELSRLRAHYEEEALRFKEAQVRVLEDMEERHCAMREEAQQEKEDEKKLLVAVSQILVLVGTERRFYEILIQRLPHFDAHF